MYYDRDKATQFDRGITSHFFVRAVTPHKWFARSGFAKDSAPSKIPHKSRFDKTFCPFPKESASGKLQCFL
ncbi:hypothetical protein MTR_3g462040 [Medicago truncatula]|uniref:Uncharacterized protein n=1 Tax=Medicago truncatula TaxID=3880 RepID=A0A072UXG6_MEDTR|nr:hypothetical protein MTR_3g462040 [Medicago truncatula]